MGLEYLPTLIPQKSTIHVGKYTSLMDQMDHMGHISGMKLKNEKLPRNWISREGGKHVGVLSPFKLVSLDKLVIQMKVFHTKTT